MKIQFAKFFKAIPEVPEGVAEKLKANLEKLNGDIGENKYLLCDEVTIADIFVFNDLLNVTELVGYELEGDNIKRFMTNMKAKG